MTDGHRREAARKAGFADAVLARDTGRLNVLYEELNKLGVAWWTGASVGILADGRVAVVGDSVGIAEVRA